MNNHLGLQYANGGLGPLGTREIQSVLYLSTLVPWVHAPTPSWVGPDSRWSK